MVHPIGNLLPFAAFLSGTGESTKVSMWEPESIEQYQPISHCFPSLLFPGDTQKL